MNKRDTLVSLRGFSKPQFKEEFSSNRKLEKIFLDVCQTHIDYAFNILKHNPYEALDIYIELNSFHDILGSMPYDILDLSVEIIVRISDEDIIKAIELIDIIEVDDFKVDALKILLKKTEDKNLILKINNLISKYLNME